MSMYSEPDVINISSDEEGELPCWIDELLDQMANFSEIPKHNDSDDECMILDGDPDKAVVKDDKGGREDGSDDLLVVGEKGQVACRDFPHSRHLCVSFPFNTTSHQKCCSLCHCYVCDSLAPCMYWGDGISLSDHCHATDKVWMWRMQRKSLKGTTMEGNPFDAALQMPPPPVRNTAPLPFQVPVSVHAQSSLTSILRPCMASIVGPPYAPGQVHCPQAAVTGPIHRPQAAVTGPIHRPQAAVTGPIQRPQAAVTGPIHRPQAAVTGLIHRPQAAVTGPIHHPHAAVTGPIHHPQAAVTGSSHHQQKAAIPSSHVQRLGPPITRSQSSVPGTPGVQRGRHGTDARACSLMQSHKNFKRVGNTGTGLSGLINSGIYRSQYIASNQNLRPLLQKSPSLPGASQRPQQRAITSLSTNGMLVTSQQKSQSMPLTSQSSHLPPISTPIYMPTSVASHTQIMPRNSHGSFAGVGSELGVSDNNDKGMATFQPYTASSLPPSVDGQAPSQIGSNQGMISYSDLGLNETLSYPLEFDESWLDGSAEGIFSSGVAQFEVPYNL